MGNLDTKFCLINEDITHDKSVYFGNFKNIQCISIECKVIGPLKISNKSLPINIPYKSPSDNYHI
jgi:hypothetical protein